MMTKWMKFLACIVPALLLSACLLTPGKFTSTLDVRADRSFTFTYAGEVIATDFGDSLSKMKEPVDAVEDAPVPADQNSAYFTDIAQKKRATTKPKANEDEGLPLTALPDKDKEAKMRGIADALRKEKGFRSVRYAGKGKFLIDYAITSRLDHSFVFPFNVDAQAVFPFVVIEVRADGRVRIQAPGFANASDKSGGMGSGSGMPDASKELDGTFTLTTDAEIISQNQEDGPTDTPRGKQVVWNASPLTKTAPMATIRFPGAIKRP
jgi:hypothetical protein